MLGKREGTHFTLLGQFTSTHGHAVQKLLAGGKYIYINIYIYIYIYKE
jgi:hypothetical protein